MVDATELALVVASIRDAASGVANIEERAKALMRAAREHWMIRDENVQLMGAMAALLETATEEERPRLERFLTINKSINALLSGVPVDVDRVMEDETEPYPILKWWNETEGQDKR